MITTNKYRKKDFKNVFIKSLHENAGVEILRLEGQGPYKIWNERCTCGKQKVLSTA